MAGAAASLTSTPRRRWGAATLVAGSFMTALSATFLFAGPSEAATTTQEASCMDGGGTRWSARAVWGSTYTAGDGVERVSIDYVGWTTSRSGIVPTDSQVRSYTADRSPYSTQTWTGDFDYQSGWAYKVRNPVNPPSSPGRVRIVVTLGVDGDGFGDCRVSFTQPGTVVTPPATPTPTPSPTATPTSTPTPPPTPTPSSPPQPGKASDKYEADVFRITNSERTSRGLVALTDQACVDKYAESQAARMAAESRMYHQDLGPILRDCGLRMVGENVAYGYSDGAAVMNGWMNSPGHRDNILNSGYRLLGVGAAQNGQGRWYSAQVFGTSAR